MLPLSALSSVSSSLVSLRRTKHSEFQNGSLFVLKCHQLSRTAPAVGLHYARSKILNWREPESMKSTSKWFLVSFFVLFTMGAMAQTVTNGQATAVQANAPTVSATAEPAHLDRAAALFMLHSQSRGLLDHTLVTGLNASLATTHAISGLPPFCPGPEGQPDGVCTGGLVCCDCIGNARCTTSTECKRECIE